MVLSMKKRSKKIGILSPFALFFPLIFCEVEMEVDQNKGKETGMKTDPKPLTNEVRRPYFSFFSFWG